MNTHEATRMRALERRVKTYRTAIRQLQRAFALQQEIARNVMHDNIKERTARQELERQFGRERERRHPNREHSNVNYYVAVLCVVLYTLFVVIITGWIA